MITIHTDGACFGNPGPMGIGIVIYKGKKKIRELSEYIGHGTNNIAEYTALIRALEIMEELGEKEALIHTDSELLAKQINGEYRVKDRKLKLLNARVDSLLTGMKVKVQHVRREKNEEADELSKAAIKGHEKDKKDGKQCLLCV
ncbi:MAG: ribonuclease HI family protein [Candidatus Micrarchaeota archaeon]